jgi:uncharacterized integral membrane protein
MSSAPAEPGTDRPAGRHEEDTTPQENREGPVSPQETPAALPHHRVRRTRLSSLWTASALFALVLLLLLVFILENSHRVEISYFGANGHLPLGIALLMAAVLGVLLAVIPGAGRIIQLRITARRHRKADNTTAPAVPAQDRDASKPVP